MYRASAWEHVTQPIFLRYRNCPFEQPRNLMLRQIANFVMISDVLFCRLINWLNGGKLGEPRQLRADIRSVAVQN